MNPVYKIKKLTPVEKVMLIELVNAFAEYNDDSEESLAYAANFRDWIQLNQESWYDDAMNYADVEPQTSEQAFRNSRLCYNIIFTLWGSDEVGASFHFVHGDHSTCAPWRLCQGGRGW